MKTCMVDEPKPFHIQKVRPINQGRGDIINHKYSKINGKAALGRQQGTKTLNSSSQNSMDIVFIIHQDAKWMKITAYIMQGDALPCQCPQQGKSSSDLYQALSPGTRRQDICLNCKFVSRLTFLGKQRKLFGFRKFSKDRVRAYRNGCIPIQSHPGP